MGDGVRRPPKPGFLPPAPPPCSISPIPSRFQGLASASRSVPYNNASEKCDSVVYDPVKKKEVKPNYDSVLTNGMSNNNTTTSNNRYEQTNNINPNSTNGESVMPEPVNCSSKDHITLQSTDKLKDDTIGITND